MFVKNNCHIYCMNLKGKTKRVKDFVTYKVYHQSMLTPTSIYSNI